MLLNDAYPIVLPIYMYIYVYVCIYISSAIASPPTIVEATIQEISDGMGVMRIFICEAVGNPLPNITWTANGNMQPLQNTTDITITTETTNEVKSQITFSSTNVVEQISCSADNGMGRVTQDMFMLVTLSPTEILALGKYSKHYAIFRTVLYHMNKNVY